MKAFVAVLLLSMAAVAQTTYTTTQNGCGGKANQYCTLSVSDGSQPFDLTIDNRVNGSGPIGTLRVSYPYPGATVFSVHGTYSGFVSNPNGTQADFYGTGSFVSDDDTVTATFNFSAHYVRTCSGRGCGGTLGWHYVVLSGSTVETP